MSTEHWIQRFKSCHSAVSIIATGATATANNVLQQAVHKHALKSVFKRSGI
jgi:hypothetical protein